MTAILGSLYQNIPTLIGDIMISSQLPPAREVVLPVSGQMSKATPIRWKTHYFTDWKQKLIAIGPSMMVAWTGRQIDAIAAVKHLREGYEACDATKLDELLEIVQSIDALGLKETGFIFLVSCEQGWRMRSYQAKGGGGLVRFQTPWNENAVAGGTGADFLIDALDAVYESNAPADFNVALGRLVLAGARMWYQDITGLGPELAFGGAYELAMKQNNDLIKLDDVLYITQVYDDSEKDIRLVPIFLKVDYLQDILVARVFDFRIESAPTIRTYAVPPVDKSNPFSQEEIFELLPSLNASTFATFLKIESSTPSRELSAALHTSRLEPQPGEADLRPIVFEYENGPLPTSFGVHQDYAKSLLEEVIATKQLAREPFP